jgi:nucleotide-binding universal stress UspA family protein
VSGPYGHVVVGTDGSATAQAAVRHAAQLALLSAARLTIVSAYTRDAGNPAELTAVTEWIATDAAGAQDHVVAGQAIARDAGVEHPLGRTEAGEPAEVILDLTTEVGGDVIVVGSKGMAAASRFLLGSVPNRITHHAPCDVIVVRTTD